MADVLTFDRDVEPPADQAGHGDARWSPSAGQIIAVPAVFLAVIAVSGVLGDLVARLYSDPMNRLIRRAFRDDARHLGSVMDVGRTSTAATLAENSVA